MKRQGVRECAGGFRRPLPRENPNHLKRVERGDVFWGSGWQGKDDCVGVGMGGSDGGGQQGVEKPTGSPVRRRERLSWRQLFKRGVVRTGHGGWVDFGGKHLLLR